MKVVKRKWACILNQKSNDIVKSLLEKSNVKASKEDFLNPKKESLADFSKLQGVDEALCRIKKAVRENEKIALYHDYDCDGITGGAVAYEMLSKIHKKEKLTLYSNNRFEEGYGLSKKGLDKLKLQGVDLIITIDLGISEISLIDYAKSLGMDIIVTDHHEAKEELPSTTIVNPQIGKIEELKVLSGAVVVWKLLSLIYPGNPDEYLDVLALSTIADVVPMNNLENRYIVKEGLKLINEEKRPFFKSLKELTKENQVTSESLGFKYGPIINSLCRLRGDVSIGVKAIIEKDPIKSKELSRELFILNEKRKEITEKELLKLEEDFFDKALVTRGDFSEGLIGIIAGKLKEENNVPTVVFSKPNNGLLKGSIRGIDSFHVLDCLMKLNCPMEFGGHKMAGGVTIKEENYFKFKSEFESFCSKNLSDEDMIRTYYYVEALSVSDLSYDMIVDIRELEPFGSGFEKPLFKLKDAKIDKVFPMGKEKNHLKIESKNISIIGWRQWQNFEDFEARKGLGSKGKISALGYPSLNIWKGRAKMQFIIKEDNFY